MFDRGAGKILSTAMEIYKNSRGTAQESSTRGQAPTTPGCEVWGPRGGSSSSRWLLRIFDDVESRRSKGNSLHLSDTSPHPRTPGRELVKESLKLLVRQEILGVLVKQQTMLRTHKTAVDEEKKRVRIDYCGKEVRGFNRLQHHLAALGSDVTSCNAVPANINMLDRMRNALLDKKKERRK